MNPHTANVIEMLTAVALNGHHLHSIVRVESQPTDRPALKGGIRQHNRLRKLHLNRLHRHPRIVLNHGGQGGLGLRQEGVDLLGPPLDDESIVDKEGKLPRGRRKNNLLPANQFENRQIRIAENFGNRSPNQRRSIGNDDLRNEGRLALRMGHPR